MSTAEQGDSPDVEIFYADPVDEDGHRIGTAEFKITHVSGLKGARATKIPHAEMAIPDDAPVIKVPPKEED